MRRLAAIKHIVTLRTLVGALGETQSGGWWESAFFAKSSAAFLSPVFPRTLMLAQVVGLTSAAAAVHDQRVGLGVRVSHLFRLPEDLERACQEALHDADLCSELAKLVASPADSLADLAKDHPPVSREPGPMRCGAIAECANGSVWGRVAAIYRDAFALGIETYPFFAG